MDFKFYVLRNYLPDFGNGLITTIIYAAIAICLAVIWGGVIGSLIFEKIPVISRLLGYYVTFFRETPLLVQMYVIFYGLPQLGLMITAPVSGVLTLMLNDGAFIAEIFRGGLQGVPKGQAEAAASLGFNRLQTLRFFLLPQAWKKILESIIGMMSIILKDTSLLAMITIVELTATAQKVNARTFEPTTAFVTAAVLYYVMYLFIEALKKLFMTGSKNAY